MLGYDEQLQVLEEPTNRPMGPKALCRGVDPDDDVEWVGQALRNCPGLSGGQAQRIVTEAAAPGNSTQVFPGARSSG